MTGPWSLRGQQARADCPAHRATILRLEDELESMRRQLGWAEARIAALTGTWAEEPTTVFHHPIYNDGERKHA